MRDFSSVKKVVIKVGSSSLVNEDYSVNKKIIDSIMFSFSELKKLGISPYLVSSGAIATGMHELKLSSRPKEIALKQACASVGQAKLMECYNEFASKYNLVTGQILLNHEDFSIRERMLNLTSTLDEMTRQSIIPIINENDVLAVEEIKVGDNDTLASLLCPMIQCDLLILFSDIDGLFDKNPKEYSDAKLIPVVKEIDDSIIALGGKSSSGVGTGGMKTKIKAALMTTLSGADMLIVNSTEILHLVDIIKGKELGTLFVKNDNPISSRDSWIIFKGQSKGSIIVDAGCKNALMKKKVSVLPKGVLKVSGQFLKGAIIDIKDENNSLLGKGISKFSSAEIEKIMGKDSVFIPGILGYVCQNEVVHANDLVVIRDNKIKELI